MNVKALMTENPASCTADTTLDAVARLMVDYDCGCIPVVDAQNRPVGVVTDRDICCRTVAQGQHPVQISASAVMTSDPVTIAATASAEECFKLMATHQIRQVVVVDAAGACCGMVAQADVAISAPRYQIAQVVAEISAPEPAISDDPAGSGGHAGGSW